MTLSIAPARAQIESGRSTVVASRVHARPDWLSPTVFSFDLREIDVAGARLTYVDEGSGPILLLAPGSPMWSFMFRNTVAALRTQFRCVVVDLPGLGLSDVPLHRGRAFADNADWLQAFVRALDLPRFTLVVHATAGPPGLEMAVREWQRIAGLVVTNSFLWPLGNVPKFNTFVNILTSPPLVFANVHLNLLPRIAGRFGRRTRRFTPDERAAIIGPFKRRDTREHLQNILLGLKTEDAFFTDVGRRITALRETPSLLLYGAHDNGCKLGFLERWKELLPRHEVVVLQHSDHFAPEDQPDEYRMALASWWERAVSEDALTSSGGE